MSSSNCCFLSYLHIGFSRGRSGGLVFPALSEFSTVCCDPHSQRLKLLTLAFLMIQWVLAIWSLVLLPFLNPAWPSGSSQFTYCWSLAWRILSITLLDCEMSAIVRYFEHSLGLPFSGLEWKLTFTSPVATAEFSKFAGILSAALSQHHLLEFEIAQLEFYHLL